ncbi:hypothetical protein VST7929_02678 [Vibrio stylophorae]|uniref:DoxX family protein n=1 Tax=Vibrio stylophorae TaxID=659351 RepID=A0ABM8ZXK2_9VIBR|nr:DoxX family protein [Vibrio stylophorae]CAH0534728.1 hypothetical protein VST7929_02678 [Vibrio stylophorae]
MRTLLHSYDRLVQTSQALLQPVVLLLARLWVAWAFFQSGLLKYNSWDSTLYLFEFEYQVPLFPWLWAAYLGTAVELIVPVFLALGLLTRPMALLLFVFNIMAVVSYPTLWAGGFYDHKFWGMMLLINIVWGAGACSVDRILTQHLTLFARS